jgi:alkylhydroperoxidase family enzyme
MARVKLLTVDEMQGDAREVLLKMQRAGREPINIHRAIANAPNALRNFLRLGNSLLIYGTLSPALRELAILRVAQTYDATYEWVHHLPLAEVAGVWEDQITNLGNWCERPNFDEREKAVLAYVDAVTRMRPFPTMCSTRSASTWARARLWN